MEAISLLNFPKNMKNNKNNMTDKAIFILCLILLEIACSWQEQAKNKVSGPSFQLKPPSTILVDSFPVGVHFSSADHFVDSLTNSSDLEENEIAEKRIIADMLKKVKNQFPKLDMGIFDFEFKPPYELGYNEMKYSCITGHYNNCTGSGCRVASYFIMPRNKSNEPIMLIEQTEDMFGLRYGDINNDGNLDFLVIEEDFSGKYLDLLVKKDAKFENWSCARGIKYTITAVNFINGKWLPVKDKSGKEYFMLIYLDQDLEVEKGFKLLESHWVGE
jgi:hypothetical protein